ncbi:MAG: hypothetical protein R2794_06060 [Chitinophagales bacterium]
MKNLPQLIQKLTTREINQLQRYYATSSRKDSILKNKLFDVLLQNPDLSDIELGKAIKKNGTPSLPMLKKRVYQDIIGVLFLNDSEKKNRSELHQKKYQVLMLMNEAELLVTRALHHQAILTVNKAKRIAVKYELTQELTAINEALANMSSTRRNIKHFENVSKETMRIINLLKDESIATDYFRKVLNLDLLEKGDSKSVIKKAQKTNDVLANLSKKTNSSRIKMYYLRSQIFYSHMIRDYEKGLKFALEFSDLVHTSPAMSAKNNIGGSGIYLSNIYMLRGEYEKAVKCAKDHINFFVKESINQLQMLEIISIGYLHCNEIKLAQEEINKGLSFKVIKRSKLFNFRFQLLQACCLFKEKKFDDALALSQTLVKHLESEPEIGVAFKIFELQCIIELGNYDWLDYRIETFRKQLKDLKPPKNTRSKTIFKLIKTLVREGYNFNKASEKAAIELQNLSDSKGDYFWDALDYEYIRFDTWWKSKIKKRAEY